MTSPPIERCPVCENRFWHDRAHSIECTHCGLVTALDPVLHPTASQIASWLRAGADPATPQGWSLPGPARRNAAWAFDHVLGLDGIARPCRPMPNTATLAMLARRDDDVALRPVLAGYAHRFRACVVLLDGAAGRSMRALRSEFAGIRFASHPLEGDFAAQRNRLQDLAGTGWVLQLDTDERPSAALLDRIGWLTAEADADGLRSLGLPRRNIVDGTQSALYPDIQYRLNRGNVRFAGRVHERPDLPFEQTSLALSAPLEHRLDPERVRERTRVYGEMSPGAARPEDERALLEPFDRAAAASR